MTGAAFSAGPGRGMHDIVAIKAATGGVQPGGAERRQGGGQRLQRGGRWGFFVMAASGAGVPVRRCRSRRPSLYVPRVGEVPEWSNGSVSKTEVRATVPWVRIPPSPPDTPTSRALRLPHRHAERQAFSGQICWRARRRAGTALRKPVPSGPPDLADLNRTFGQRQAGGGRMSATPDCLAPKSAMRFGLSGAAGAATSAARPSARARALMRASCG